MKWMLRSVPSSNSNMYVRPVPSSSPCPKSRPSICLTLRISVKHFVAGCRIAKRRNRPAHVATSFSPSVSFARTERAEFRCLSTFFFFKLRLAENPGKVPAGNQGARIAETVNVRNGNPVVRDRDRQSIALIMVI